MNMEINGVTLQADFMDADFMDIFEPAICELQNAVGKAKTQKNQSTAAGYRELNSIVENFFNTVWGPDASDRIFKGSKNVMVHLEAVARIEAAHREERKQFNNLSNQYTQRQQSGFQSMQGHKPKQKQRHNHV